MIKVWLKQDVYGDLQSSMQKAHGKIVAYYESAGVKNFYVTSRRDGIHIPGSLHYIGLAEDFEKHKLVTKIGLQRLLGTDFDVIEYENHFHIEYDPKEEK